MNNRKSNLNKLWFHPHYIRLMKKLSAKEIDTISEFLSDKEKMRDDEYTRMILRGEYKIDVREKNQAIVNELLFVCETMSQAEPKRRAK